MANLNVFFVILTVLGQWEYRPIEGEDTTIIYCQFYRKPCKNPTLFPVPRRSASVILYRTWEQADIDNLCPGESCGPFCNTTDPSCFIEYRIPKSLTDSTLGGRSLPLAGGSTDPVGYLNDSFCPPNCCQAENCKRYRDINGAPVPTNHEILLVFGGTALRNVTLNGTLLFNDCSEENIKLARQDYRLEVTESCGIEILNEIWRYDIKNDSWNYLQPSYHPSNSNYSFPYPRHSHRAVLVEQLIYDTLVKTTLLKKYMYIYGGFALECRDACDDMWRFEIPWASQTYYPKSSGFWNRGGYWEQLTQSYSPGRRMSHNLVVSKDSNYLYLFGGLGKNLLYKDLWRYTVLTNTWQELVTYGISKVSRKITTWNGTEYDLILNISEKRLNDTITYSATGSKPVERMSACLLYFTSASEYIFLFGGLGTRYRLFDLGNASIALNDFWVFSVSSQKWTQIFSDTEGPSERYEANIIQIDSTRLAVYGGRHGEIVYDDFWAYNIETNHWFNWTMILKTSDFYPEGRYKGSLIRTSEGLVVYSGSYTVITNLSETDLSTEEYMTYTSECQEILNFYGVSIYDIGTDEFAEEQLRLYLLSGSKCFLRTDPIPIFKGSIKYLQGIWVFNLNTCADNCNERGFCEFGTCYCFDGYFGVLCEYKTCPGTFCIYDNEFFSTSECVHCSGYGECMDGVCNCTDGYSGDDCSKKTCRDDCNFDGTCIEMYPISQCDCFGKFGGDTCQNVLCLNNCNEPYGSCNTTTGICTCLEGFYGVDCSVVGISFASFLLPLGFILVI